MLQIATSTITEPSFRRFPGIQAVDTYSPGGVGLNQRRSVSIALLLLYHRVSRRPHRKAVSAAAA